MDFLREHYLDWPKEVSVETFAKCNAACVFCPYPTLERQGVRMPDEMLARIVDELRDHPHPFYFSPFKVNEPFLDKRLIPLCRTVNEKLPLAVLRLFTNGSALTDAHIGEVASLSRVVHLWVSLNSHEAGEYERVMSLPFERTAANLDRLHEVKAGGQFPHPVTVSKVREGFEIGERDSAFADYVADRWPLFECRLIKRDSWLGFIEPNDRPVPDAPCGRWFELSVTATGLVSLCCMDGKAEFAIGDLNEQSLFEVYNSREYRRRRLGMISRKDVSPCASCNY